MEDIQWRVAGQSQPTNAAYKKMLTKVMRQLARDRRARSAKLEVMAPAPASPAPACHALKSSATVSLVTPKLSRDVCVI